MGQLFLNKVQKFYGDYEVLKGVQLDVKNGEFVVFVGPSGCGKSTLLRMIAGLDATSAGDIVIDGIRVNDLPPVKRGIAMVFQSYALYPHMTVFENIAFPLRVERMEEEKLKAKVENAARILHLEQRLQQKPGMLSGGQRQRVAIGRAIVREPKIFLFDEPLSNLDAALRADMRIELAKLHRQLKATMIYVTHDQVEAMTMADRIVVLDSGDISQTGAPLELYHKPANQFVAGFIGNPKMNFLPVTCNSVSANGVEVDYQGQTALLPVAPRDGIVGKALTLGIRPEHIQLNGGDIVFTVTPTVIERLGANTVAYASLNGEAENFCAMLPGSVGIRADVPVATGINAADCHLFDEAGIAFERRVELTEIDMNVINPTAA
ncbi:sn-glycerol-3-phosphate ABC transporter ATP-binding protein UgpC [Rhizobium ruizarguesonis]|uniref:Sn-glycerol-3-phosphate ABC transporter ATP-binding protein UgpC n=1 Tax=Rhizobium ruizarguesonis TaxID=2081791 RepID=A0ABY1X043_9HYPH|nr:sn-glycerol-3-phosphate ABC transporter ATP-binding protein UgpC [Rhizobium ruizarguesonis]TAU71774.1 sn-glycerol-3-phosphate ABC transporter ATP-binding protein UgpC [Rhizobium ruizarguesonis]TAV23823.1 sn-glycerol-3-phosphate ABC transporter ATP-binding protein UgpC [Rhizobium ruizarguesonis]TAV24866.1 sn-glycerol-3-phosphate ABC transporter ATP-binding protein UgpC [Rhizobium ruizarguesonis]TAW49605.1 sn-glycerol-3-phosphate ABC transporter ATP-binding protein UgpC [Rhizobium ruizargueson